MESVVSSGGRTDEPDVAARELSEDRIFSLLSVGRRREALRCLQAEGGEAPLSVITRRVAIAEGIDPDAGAKAFKKVYVSLYQTHLPAMADAGVAEYDGERKVVELTARAAPLFTYLDIGREEEETTGTGPEGATAGSSGLLSRFFSSDCATN